MRGREFAACEIKDNVHRSIRQEDYLKLLGGEDGRTAIYGWKEEELLQPQRAAMGG